MIDAVVYHTAVDYLQLRTAWQFISHTTLHTQGFAPGGGSDR